LYGNTFFLLVKDLPHLSAQLLRFFGPDFHPGRLPPFYLYGKEEIMAIKTA
jgi:hypothetical protein